MQKKVVVPIGLEALFLSSPTPVRESFADFTRLPYCDGKDDINADVAYISEEILTAPFADVNLMLPAGMHLHWVLPGVLTKTQSIGEKNRMPPVPDRWLVTRLRNNVADKNWLVESDYLSSVPLDNGLVRCHVPYFDGNQQSANMPFRFLGQVKELNLTWSNAFPPSDERIQNLTAVGYDPQPGATGYAEPTFAAFYPHCCSVFGFYDKDITSLSATNGLSYQVLGFYARPEKDYLTQFIMDFIKQQSGKTQSVKKFNNSLYQKISQEFNWQFDYTVPPAEGAIKASFTLDDVLLPSQSFFSARIECASVTQKSPAPYYTAVGNTATEALSAFLANKIDGEKAVIEDQLEAIQLNSRLNNRNLDIGAKFKEARHEKGFSALPGETQWSVILRSTAGTNPDPASDTISVDIIPEDDMSQLNSLQQQYERAQLELITMQQQLYADWNKYMLCAYPPEDNQDAYPDIDEAKSYIEKIHLDAIAQAKDSKGELLIQQNQLGELVGASSNVAGNLAALLAAQMNKVLAQVQALNTVDLKKNNKRYILKPLSGPRYWRPNDPVVLLAQQGPAKNGVAPGGRDPRATLSCVVMQPRALSPVNLDAASLLITQKSISDLYLSKQLTATQWSGNLWQPFVLEWKVEVFPSDADGNLSTADRSYTPDFITHNYRLDETDTEFSEQESSTVTDTGETIYSGMSILTPNAGIKLGADLEVYITEWIKTDWMNRYFDSQNVNAKDRTFTYLISVLDSFSNWTKTILSKFTLTPLPTGTDVDVNATLSTWWTANLAIFSGWYLSLTTGMPPEVIKNLMKSYQQLQGWQCVAQSLGGFNEALLMRQQVRQLEIADPVGFSEYQDFTARVKEAVSGQNYTAPLPLNDFNPVRSGHMKILDLQLLDNFGQIMPVSGFDQNLIVSEPLRDVTHNELILLRPRLSQAARLNFRWLSAEHSADETKVRRDTNLICGWMVPNYLDNSLAFYNEYGQSLGSLTQDPDAPWQQAPGSIYARGISQIENVHLQHVVTYLYNQQVSSLSQVTGTGKESFLDLYLDVLENGLERIHPENSAQHTDLIFLMGRPLAIMRVSLDLQLLGQPATHQGWDVFIKQLQGDDTYTDGLLSVKFPVRLGEQLQLNDGLIGYWEEGVEEQFGQVFYSCSNPVNVSVTIGGQAQTYTVIMDPRGKLHATSGILPTKVIDVPYDQYASALGNIETTFQVTPLICDDGTTKINLPLEPGYNWSWLERNGAATWNEIPRVRVISQESFQEKMPEPANLWSALSAAGWLQPQTGKTDTAVITPKDQRKAATDGNLSEAVLDNVSRVFDAYGQGLQPMDTTITFASRQTIREGWLKLRPDPGQSAEQNDGPVNVTEHLHEP